MKENKVRKGKKKKRKRKRKRKNIPFLCGTPPSYPCQPFFYLLPYPSPVFKISRPCKTP
jgi:hypothetical protein